MTTVPPERKLDSHYNVITEEDEAAAAKRIRNSGYIWAVLVWPVGLCLALYIAVAERTVSIRRHAIGVAGVSLLAAAVSLTVYFAVIAPAASNANVTSDLRSILDSNSISYTSVDGCTHSTGDQYDCTVTTSNGTQVVTVTDDGHGYATEQGLG
jgi:hypothetical protein